MCTLILATRVFDDSAAFLASNRDERLDRPAVGPFLWDVAPPIVAPRDEERGGTWFGVNARGVLAAITNRYGVPRNREKRSRGELIPLALEASTAIAAAETVAAMKAPEFNPFHLVFADADGAHVVWSDGTTSERRELAPGVHVVTERSFGAAENGRAESLTAAIAQLTRSGGLTRPALTELLAVRRIDDIDCTCVLIPEMNYGTRSSALVDLERRTLEFSHGPPCETDYEDYSRLLRDLLK